MFDAWTISPVGRGGLGTTAYEYMHESASLKPQYRLYKTTLANNQTLNIKHYAMPQLSEMVSTFTVCAF